MASVLQNIIRIYLLCLYSSFLITSADGEKIQYADIQRPLVQYVNLKFAKFANMSSFRFGRRNPIYYTNLITETVVPFDNKVQVSFYFYEFLTNRYQRNFVEMHFRLCDLIHKDKLFGAAMKQGKLDRPCPYPPDLYEMYNMTIAPAAIPRGFPFTKGRIECNLTYPSTKETIGSVRVDLELKQLNDMDWKSLNKKYK